MLLIHQKKDKMIHSSSNLVDKLEHLQSVLQSGIKAAKQEYESYLIKQFALSCNPGIYCHIKFLTSQMHLESTRAILTGTRLLYSTIISSLFSHFVQLSFLPLRACHYLLLVLVTVNLACLMFTMLLLLWIPVRLLILMVLVHVF